MLDLLAVFGCILALGYVLYYALAFAVGVVLFPFVLVWVVLKFALMVILVPITLIGGLLSPK